jgi:hypothetical protein
VLTETLGQLQDISRHLPPETLRLRLRLLEEGVAEVRGASLRPHICAWLV